MKDATHTRRRLALHACCGPCLLEPFDELLAEGFEITVVYANPNIQPEDEYRRRRDTLLEHAAESGIDVIELECDPGAWHEAVGDPPESREARCRACYRLRLGLVSRWAAENGCDTVSTTLTVSPYQNSRAIAEEGERVAREAGVVYLDRDYRERYGDATRRSRELGMYRQNYCGCMPSSIEAQRGRDERKAERQRRKA